jgi:hypothetical protein
MAKANLPAQTFFEKHLSKIDFCGPGGCWVWVAGKVGNGYGAVSHCGRGRLAHRIAYESVHGAGSASGLVVRHRCDTPPCVNPDHLELGTHADNVRDKVARGRQSKGEANGNTKLTEADVRLIRDLCISGSAERGLSAMARRFGVCRGVVGRVVRREVWKHVT